MIESIRKNFKEILTNNLEKCICPYCKNLYEIKQRHIIKMKSDEPRFAVFCSKSCSSKGRNYIKKCSLYEDQYICNNCNLQYNSNNPKRKTFNFCSSDCIINYKNNNIEDERFKHICECSNLKDSRAIFCQHCSSKFYWNSIGNATIAEYIQQTRDNYISNQKYQKIRSKAREYLKFNKVEKKCKICNFDYFVEACHIKSIASFSETALISEVNSLENLVYLCPNHHVMLDKGIEPELFIDLKL